MIVIQFSSLTNYINTKTIATASGAARGSASTERRAGGWLEFLLWVRIPRWLCEGGFLNEKVRELGGKRVNEGMTTVL